MSFYYINGFFLSKWWIMNYPSGPMVTSTGFHVQHSQKRLHMNVHFEKEIL